MVVGGCRWFQVVLGGFRSFLVLVLTICIIPLVLFYLTRFRFVSFRFAK